MKIRSATVADQALITALWETCGLTVAHNNRVEDFHFAFGKSGSDVLVAETDHVVGSVLVGHDGHRGWLYYVAVAPDFRGQGIGRLLVAAAEAWLRERGVPKAHLMV